MKRIRVLIVEGSPATREAIRQQFGREPDLELAGLFSNGRVALAQLTDLSPDVIVLDVAEPDLEGLKTLTSLRLTHPTLPVLVFSQLTQRGSQVTVDALLQGANEYVSKPGTQIDLSQTLRGELVPRIKALAMTASGNTTPRIKPLTTSPDIHGALLAPVAAITSPENRAGRERSFKVAEIVAIATSTGGPNALATLLSLLPPSFATPIVIVQHMSSGFTATLADSLRRQTRRVVQEVVAATAIHDAAVWIAAGGRHLVVKRDGMITQVAPDDGPAENECCPSADVLFRSVANVYGSRCLAVVLTGMGYDGLAGCHAIRQAGGSIIVQDEASSISWGMPGQVARAGLADQVLSLTELAQEISRLTNSNRPGVRIIPSATNS